MNRVFLLLVLFILVFPTSLQARTWLVRQDGSGDCTTIQACIDSAQAGDIVLVGGGTYYENLAIQGKAISLLSEHGASQTIIDGQSENTLERVLYCADIPSPGLVISGLTITNGGNSSGKWPYNLGAGVFFWNSKAEIKECVVTSNWGGNIGIDPASTVSIHHNSISLGHTGNGAWGDGVLCRSSDVTISHNSFSQNRAAGVDIQECSPTVEHNWIETNPSAIGIEINGYSAAPSIRLNVILGASESMGISNEESSPLVENNTIIGHRTGLYPGFYSTPTYRNNIVTACLHGIECMQPVQRPNLSCNDFWNNGDDFDFSCWGADTIAAFHLDPLFCDPANKDYTLSCYSPCANRPGCGLVGALNVACGPTSVTETTWGKIKALFR